MVHQCLSDFDDFWAGFPDISDKVGVLTAEQFKHSLKHAFVAGFQAGGKYGIERMNEKTMEMLRR